MPITETDTHVTIDFYTDPPPNPLTITAQTRYLGPSATLFLILCAQQRATGIDRYHFNLDLVGRELGINGPRLAKVINRLIRLGAIRDNNGRYEITRFPGPNRQA